MKNILVTGGTGYIGSHTCISLLKKGYKLTVIDSNINSSILSLEKIRLIINVSISEFNKILFFKKGDIRDKIFLKKIFQEAKTIDNPIEAVIHFAGLKAVGESVIQPLKYWENNVYGSVNLFQIMEENNCNTIVFSSSANIYGQTDLIPIKEDSKIKPINTYGHTKATIEYILKSLFNSKKNKWKIANLRYFNPIGAHESGLIGENPLSIPNNLFPFICGVAIGRYDFLKIFGNDWPTFDGTGIRDYIHVADLADAHALTLDYLFKNKSQIINLNIGTGKGTSVLELVEEFKNVTGKRIPYKFVDRRLGDIPIAIANNKKATLTLRWIPKRSIKDMCKDGWNWQFKNPSGYR
tara:strand:+ start:1323 stop:2378 length:1056 start_codon:yes stop_codon:yes gene_type:complete